MSVTEPTQPAQPGAAAEPLMRGKRGLVMGVANDRSIAWGIAKALHGEGAELAFTYQGEAFGKRVVPLAESLGAGFTQSCDADKEESVKALFDGLAGHWDSLDFVVHAIAFSDKEQLKGPYLDTTRDNFSPHALAISCYSFTSIARRAARLMPNGGSLITLTYLGAERVTPNYNVMGVAKAALEASVRYLAADLGRSGHPGERHLGRAHAHPGRLGHRRCALRLPLEPASTRRSGATSTSRRSARPGSTSAPASPPASPASSTTSMPATTSSAFQRRGR